MRVDSSTPSPATPSQARAARPRCYKTSVLLPTRPAQNDPTPANFPKLPKVSHPEKKRRANSPASHAQPRAKQCQTLPKRVTRTPVQNEPTASLRPRLPQRRRGHPGEIHLEAQLLQL